MTIVCEPLSLGHSSSPEAATENILSNPSEISIVNNKDFWTPNISVAVLDVESPLTSPTVQVSSNGYKYCTSRLTASGHTCSHELRLKHQVP